MPLTGDLTRAEMRSEVLANLGNRPADTNNTTRVNRLLDLAQVRIAREYNWSELEVTDSALVAISGTPALNRSYTAFQTIDLREIHTLSVATTDDREWKLTQYPRWQFEQLFPAISAAVNVAAGDDFPLYYTVVGKDTILWWPEAKVQFTLWRRYTKWPLKFANDNAKSDFTFKDDIIIALTTHSAFLSLGQGEDSAVWFAVYRDLITKAIIEEGQTPDLDLINRGLTAGPEGVIATDPVADPFVRRTV